MVTRRFPNNPCRRYLSCSSRDPTPPEKYARIKVGDVGFIRRGKFYLLFSAGCPVGNRKLGDDVPATFEPLDVGTLYPGLSRRGPRCLRTSTVRQVGVNLGVTASAGLYAVFPPSPFTISNIPHRPLEPGASFSFELTQDRGAALATKFPTHKMDATDDLAFEEYTARHHRSWVEFAKKKRYGKNVQPVLVSGFDVTRDFLMFAYFHEEISLRSELSADVPVIASVSASMWGTWRANCTPHIQEGPQGYGPLSPERAEELASLQLPGGGIPEEFDQCVFIRYYTIRWKMGLFPKVSRAGAGPHDLGSGDNLGGAFQELTIQSDVELTASSDDDLEGQMIPAEDEAVFEQGVAVHNTPSVWFL